MVSHHVLATFHRTKFRLLQTVPSLPILRSASNSPPVFDSAPLFLSLPLNLIAHTKNLVSYRELKSPVYRNHFWFELLQELAEILDSAAPGGHVHGKHSGSVVVFSFPDKLLKLDVVIHHG